jgi:hypothetical protein
MSRKRGGWEIMQKMQNSYDKFAVEPCKYPICMALRPFSVN